MELSFFNRLSERLVPKLGYEYLREFADLAAESGFKLLEPKWLGATEKHRFLHIESGKEYQWTPSDLKYYGFPKLDYEKLKELADLATESGFKLLEPKWLGADKKHWFLHIESGEEFQWTPKQLKQYGFPKLDYEKLKEIADRAAESGFKLLEPVWLGDKEKHRFLHIASGEEFQLTPHKLKQDGFPKRFTQSQAPLPKQSAAEPAPASALDQIASQLKALKSDVTLSKAEKQAAMNARAAELAALMPPCPYEDGPPQSPTTSPMEPAANDGPEVEPSRRERQTN